MTAIDCNNTHQGPPGEDEHNVNLSDGGVPHTNNGAQGDTDRQARVYRQQTGSCEWN